MKVKKSTLKKLKVRASNRLLESTGEVQRLRSNVKADSYGVNRQRKEGKGLISSILMSTLQSGSKKGINRNIRKNIKNIHGAKRILKAIERKSQ